MFRLTFLPIVLILGTLFFGIFSFLIIRKIKKGIEVTVKKGTELASKQQKKWSKKDQLKKLPEILQKGFDRYEKLLTSHEKLPSEWREPLRPLVEGAKFILDDVADTIDLNDAERTESNKKLNSIRPFFNHTLDALLQFSEKIKSDHEQMDDVQRDKVRQNIAVFKADLLQHRETLLKTQRMDFDVLMDVIKARLKK